MTKKLSTRHEGPNVQEHIMITFGVVLTVTGAMLFLLGSAGHLLRDLRHLRLPHPGAETT
jgi:hypothetical protein